VGENTQTPPAEAEPETETAEPKKATAKPAESTMQPFTLKVVVAADGASWLRVTIDDKTAYEGTLTGGQSKEFEVPKEARLRIGKPEAVTVLKDGQPVVISKAGDVGNVTISHR
jgi:hypothetical protein